MSTSEELVSILRERFNQSEERVDFHKTFMNHARDQNCREAKMTAMTLRHVFAVYLDIRVTDSKFKLLPELVSLLGFTDRNMKVDCRQVIDRVIGKDSNEAFGSARSHENRRPSWRSSASSSLRENIRGSHITRQDFLLTNRSTLNQKSSANPGPADFSSNVILDYKSSKRSCTYAHEPVINSGPPKVNTSSSGAEKSKLSIEDLERQYRMAVIELQVAEYDNKLYRKTMDQLRKQVEAEKYKQEKLKTKFEVRKRKLRNVKQKFRTQSEVLLHEIVSLSHKCNEVFKSQVEEIPESKNINCNSGENIKNKMDKTEQREGQKEQKSAENGASTGMGDSFVKPMKVPLTVCTVKNAPCNQNENEES